MATLFVLKDSQMWKVSNMLNNIFFIILFCSLQKEFWSQCWNFTSVCWSSYMCIVTLSSISDATRLEILGPLDPDSSKNWVCFLQKGVLILKYGGYVFSTKYATFIFQEGKYVS